MSGITLQKTFRSNGKTCMIEFLNKYQKFIGGGLAIVFAGLWIFILLFVWVGGASAQIRVDSDNQSGLGFGICPVKDLNLGNVQQLFTPTEDFYLEKVILRMRRVGFGDMTASSTMYITDAGEQSIFGQLTIDSNAVPLVWTDYEFDFRDQNIYLELDFTYEIFYSPDATQTFAFHQVRTTTNIYDGGGHSCTLTGYDGVNDLVFSVWGFPIEYEKMLWFVPSVYATTSCEFVHDGNTTSAECSDSILINSTQDVANGLYLFFIIFFGILFYVLSLKGRSN